MTPEELIEELGAGRIRPAYLVGGSEPLLRDEAVGAIRDAVLAGGPEDFNLDRLEGDATTPAELWDAVRTLPMLAERRLVWLRAPTSAARAWRALSEILPEVLEALADGSEAVLLVSAASVDRRQGWVKAFRDPAASIECEPPRRAREVLDFVRGEAKRQSVKIEPDAAARLAERVGPQLLVLRGEIEKAALLAGAGRPVTLDHVTRAVADVAEEPIWDLTDAIGDGRVGDALGALSKLLEGGAPAPVVLGALASHFRKLWRVRSGGRVSAPPFVARKLDAQARGYSPVRLGACMRAIHETDEILKGQGSLSSELALERLVLGLARR